MSESGKSKATRESKRTPRILVVHGPNLNLLGRRETDMYGTATLADIDKELSKIGDELACSVETFQSNSEGELVSRLQQARDAEDGVLINAAAYTHTSVAIRDTVLALDIPVVEVHLTNIHKREEFRHRSLLADVVEGQVIGFGADSYRLGLRALANLLSRA